MEQKGIVVCSIYLLHNAEYQMQKKKVINALGGGRALVFVQKNFFGVYSFFACLVFQLTAVRATLAKSAFFYEELR